MAKSHLVILKKPYLEAILSGRKTIESRFTKTKRPPFGQIEAGDRLFLKLSSGPVCGTAVQRIRYAENETNYCPRCQTGGKLLADRSLSRLLKSDWPRTVDEWEG